MIDLNKIVLDILEEDNVSGGEGSAFGSGVVATASQQSGDTYAPGDARIPYSVYGGVLTRKGLIKRRKRRKKRKKRKKK